MHPGIRASGQPGSRAAGHPGQGPGLGERSVLAHPGFPPGRDRIHNWSLLKPVRTCYDASSDDTPRHERRCPMTNATRSAMRGAPAARASRPVSPPMD